MRLTLSQLKKIIKEEVEGIMSEGSDEDVEKTPLGMIDFYKNNPEKWKWAWSQYKDMAKGGTGEIKAADGTVTSPATLPFYPGWTTEDFKQVLRSLPQPKESEPIPFGMDKTRVSKDVSLEVDRILKLLEASNLPDCGDEGDLMESLRGLNGLIEMMGMPFEGPVNDVTNKVADVIESVRGLKKAIKRLEKLSTSKKDLG